MGKKAVEDVLAHKMAWNSSKMQVEHLERDVEDAIGDGENLVNLNLDLAEAYKRMERLYTVFCSKRDALGVDGRLNLAKLTGSEYLQLRMNARALKKRIRERLRQRKFEHERFERAYRSSTNGMSNILT
jgi:hypothetical protein